MGSFEGHIIPGTFFIVFACWWSISVALRYARSAKSPNVKSRLQKQYTTSPTMPCFCCPIRWQKYPLESFLKIFFTVAGILIEGLSGFRMVEETAGDNSNMTMPMPSMENEHHHMNRRETSSTGQWYYMGTHAQHLTMYTGFLIGAIVEVMIHYKIHLPPKIDFFCGIFAFAAEGILFQFHLHARSDLDTQLHVLLVITIYMCAISGILEYINPHNVLFTYSRILFTFLQGTWFWQTAFVLYPPFKFLENRWDPNNHNHIMFVTTSYIWHFFIIFITLLVQFLILNYFYGGKYNVMEEDDNLFDSKQLEYLMLNNNKTGNGSANRSAIDANSNKSNFKNDGLSDNDSEI